MPLIGFDTKEYGQISLEKATTIVDKGYSIDGYEPEVVRGIISEYQVRGDRISPSALTGCLRSIYLERTNDYYGDIGSLYWSFRGQIAHAICEAFKTPNCLTEQDLQAELDGITIYGRVDKYDTVNELLVDFKTTKSVPRWGALPQHKEQLQYYKWLLAKNGYNVKTMRLCYLDMSDQKSFELKNVASLEQIEQVLKEKANILNKAFKEKVVPNVPEEFPCYWKCKGYCPVAEKCIALWKKDVASGKISADSVDKLTKHKKKKGRK